MTLRDLLAGARLEPSAVKVPQGRESSGAADPEITGLAYSSDGVFPGHLFFCVPGFRADGHDFAAGAVERGAAALVCERPLGLGVPELVVPSVRSAMAPIAACFNGDPTARLRVVGVTGTNGKTTTAFLLRHILETAGIQTGLLGTVESVVGGRRLAVERTTPEAVELQATFRQMLEAGDRACVMEVSSHALELHRADAISFECAVFTNLTQDHLDFHASLEDYFGAKRSLFVQDRRPRAAAAAINSDDDWGRRLARDAAESGQLRPLTFGLEPAADYSAGAIRSGAAGTSFTCTAAAGMVAVTVPLPGLFNVYNALGAIAAAGTLGVGLDDAARALAGAPRVPGRFEPVDEGQEFSVVIDYAHTPDGLENVLSAGRELLERQGGEGRLVCVFGAGGDRDRAKRPLMGAAARRLADVVVVTSDNPRSEDPGAIIAEILEGAGSAASSSADGAALEVEPDRRAAIERGFERAGAGDLVVIAGKGHEQGQELANGRKIPFDDRDVARELLRALRSRAA